MDFQHIYHLDLTRSLMRQKSCRWLVWRLTGLLRMPDSLARLALTPDDETLDDSDEVPAAMIAG